MSTLCPHGFMEKHCAQFGCEHWDGVLPAHGLTPVTGTTSQSRDGSWSAGITDGLRFMARTADHATEAEAKQRMVEIVDATRESRRTIFRKLDWELTEWRE